MKILFTICLLTFLSLCGFRAYKSIDFNQNCGGYLKQAGAATTVEIAAEKLERATSYLALQGMTDGYTSVVWRTEDENVGFFYENLCSALEELRGLPEGASALEKTNVLMKLKESLVHVPDGISVFPHNILLGVIMTVTGIVTILGIMVACPEAGSGIGDFAAGFALGSLFD